MAARNLFSLSPTAGALKPYDDRHEDGVQRAVMKSGLFQAAKRDG